MLNKLTWFACNLKYSWKYEINPFANSLGLHVVGGASGVSLLFIHFKIFPNDSLLKIFFDFIFVTLYSFHHKFVLQFLIF